MSDDFGLACGAIDYRRGLCAARAAVDDHIDLVAEELVDEFRLGEVADVVVLVVGQGGGGIGDWGLGIGDGERLLIPNF